jgi:type IV pilus assembly protein PilM
LTEQLSAMALPFLSSSSSRKRDSILAVDLGGRTTKAVYIQRKGETYVLSGYAVQDAPIYEKNISAEMLGEHLKNIAQTMELKGKPVTLALSVADSIVRPAEMPMMPVGDMRQVLKVSAKNYLQQDLPGHVFDCFIMPTRTTPAPAADPKAKAQPAVVPKLKVLIGGTRQQLVGDVQEAVRTAGLHADSITPGLIGPVNAFELAMPEVFAKENVALIDIGFKNTTICILQEGELALSRVVNIGGDRLTAGLAEILSISYSEAEGLKVGMPADVHPHMEPLLTSLGRELRASIDYFEHQHDKAVSQVFVSGGSARSDLVLQSLQAELMVECKTWNPVGFMQNSLPPAQLAELDAVAGQLTIAVGAAVAAL